MVDRLYPEVGESVVRVLRRLGVDVRFDPAQGCCGQPAFNSGYWKDAMPLARQTIRLFSGSERVVVPSGSCASMIRIFYEELFHDSPEDLAAARALAPRVLELSEFLVDELGCGARPGQDEGGGERLSVTYHESCHLRRELGAGTQARALLGSLPGVEVAELDQAEVCCGFGGTFAVKYADISGAMLRDKVERVIASGADVVTAADASCLMHIAGGLERAGSPVRAMHLAQVLDGRLGGGAGEARGR